MTDIESRLAEEFTLYVCPLIVRSRVGMSSVIVMDFQFRACCKFRKGEVIHNICGIFSDALIEMDVTSGFERIEISKRSSWIAILLALFCFSRLGKYLVIT